MASARLVFQEQPSRAGMGKIVTFAVPPERNVSP